LRAFWIGGGVEVYALLAGICLLGAENCGAGEGQAKASVGGGNQAGLLSSLLGADLTNFAMVANSNAVEFYGRW
jgi:hypothetical protein